MIAVTGPHGRLGRQLVKEGCRPIYARIDDPAALSSALTEAADQGMTCLINCAAYTDVDGAERDTVAAMRSNVLGVYNLASTLPPQIKLIHLSTDFIFDGKGAPYPDALCHEQANPLGAYGLTKYLGECILVARRPDSVIVRTTNLFGPDGGDFVSGLRQKLSQEKYIGLPCDLTGNPTYIPDLAAALVKLSFDKISMSKLANSEYYGVINLAGPEIMSRYEFGVRIAHSFGFDEKLIRRETTVFLLPGQARRPQGSGLATALAAELGLQFRTVDEALADLVQHDKDKGLRTNNHAQMERMETGRPDHHQPGRLGHA